MNKLLTLCAAFLVAACHLALAYNFQDSDFNLLLSSELEDIVDSLDSGLLHPRVRRDDDAANDEKCRKRHRKSKLCCAETTIDAFHDKYKDISKACFKEVTGNEKPDKHERGHHKNFDLFSCEEVEKRKNEITCVHQCVAEKKGLLTEAGSPDEDKLTDYLKEGLAQEAWFAGVVDKIVATCIAEAKNATENPPKFYTEGLKVCNPTGLTLKHCLFKEIQLSCPADQIKDKASCDKFQERIKKGIDIYGPSPIPFDGPKDE